VNLVKIQKEIKISIPQIDVSEDLKIGQQSEEILFDYVEHLKDIMHGLCNNFNFSMHKNLKDFGNTLKKTKKENKKSIKEVSKSYTESKKKADKFRDSHSGNSLL